MAIIYRQTFMMLWPLMFVYLIMYTVNAIHSCLVCQWLKEIQPSKDSAGNCLMLSEGMGKMQIAIVQTLITFIICYFLSKHADDVYALGTIFNNSDGLTKQHYAGVH